VTTIHLHSDGKWWFWQDDGMIEQGPFASQAACEEACRSFSASTEKTVVRGETPFVFSKQILIALLAVFIYWLIFERHR